MDPGPERARGHVRSGRAYRLGFVAPSVHGYFFGSLQKGARETATARGARVLSVQTWDAGIATFGSDLFTLQLAWDHFDALLAVPFTVDPACLSAFAGSGRPVVTLFQTPEGLECPTVAPDNHDAIHLLVEHLVGHGHTDIAFVGRDPANADDAIRYAAYRDVMAAHGLRAKESVLLRWTPTELFDTVDVVQRLGGRGGLPTAVVACTDVTAMALVDGLRRAGVSVPGDMAVVGFDDIAEASSFSVPLTTVAQSFPLAGATAAALALDALDGRPVAPGLHCTKVQLVVRESCGCGQDATGTGSPAVQPLGTRFANDLAGTLHGMSSGHGGDVRTAAQTVADLFALAAGSSEADIVSLAQTAAEALRGLGAGSALPLAMLEPLRRLAQAAGGAAHGDDAVMIRLERLALEVTGRLLQVLGRQVSEAVVNQDVEIQRRHNMISTDLVRRYNRDIRSLAWLEGTEVRAACFGLWENGRGTSADGILRIVGTHSEEGEGGRVDEVCRVQEFPPAAFLTDSDRHPDDLTFVLQVRFDGSDWGLLALSGPFDPVDFAPVERLNHWAVLLTVALDSEQAIRSERALRGIEVSEERYALAAEAANDGLWDWDLATGAVYFSTRWKALLGHTEDEISAAPDEWLKRIHPQDRAMVDQALAQHLGDGSPTLELEYRLRTRDGGYRWMLTHCRAVRDDEGRATRLVGAMTDITDRKRLEERLRHDAHYDVLTGLPNRTLLLDRLNQLVQRARRDPGHRFAVVLLDLDSFKVVNDSLGHHIGDEVLIQVAKRLQAEIRTTDTVSRLGGDEFVLLLDDVQDVDTLPATVNRLLSELSAPLALADHTRSISIAAGVTVNSDAYRTAEEYVRDADTAMYQAKMLGPGQVVMFDKDMHLRAMARLHLESDLDRALEEGQFELYYQPILRLEQRQAIGLEALIRWNHPDRGLVPPNDFLPLAETTGQARPIGVWTIQESCRQLRAWLDERPERDDFTVSINLSNRQFWDPRLRTILHEALATYRISPSRLILEVTEGVVMNDETHAVSFMQDLRDDGFELHIDDFGTGYSSLSALHALPVDALKIDRSFVNRIRTNERSRELVRLMVTMGARFGISVIAEGIETEEEAAALLELGSPLVQGYLFGRPGPAADVLRYFPPAPR